MPVQLSPPGDGHQQERASGPCLRYLAYMTSYPQPGQQASRGPSKAWTVVAVAAFAVGLALTGFFVWKAVANAPTSPQTLGTGLVRLDDEGLTIYASRPVPDATCEAKNSSGEDVPLARPSGSENITINSTTWYVVLRSAEPVPAGDYAVSCVDDGQATFAAGPRSTVVGFVLAIFGAIGSLLVFVLIGVALLVVAGVKRRRANRPPPASTFPGGPASGHEPPGRTFPTSPPQPGQPRPTNQPWQPGQPGPSDQPWQPGQPGPSDQPWQPGQPGPTDQRWNRPQDR
jgi:hypothetical protein